jgi:hypothetical protein
MAAVVMSSGGCGTTCEPFRVTVEGQPMPMFRGVAARIPDDLDGGGYVVAMFNHQEMDCRALFDALRRKKDDELMVRVYFTRNAPANIAVNFSNDMGRKLHLVREPARVGDTVEICIPEPSIHEGSMAYQRRRVVVQGLVTAEFCGDEPQ